MSRFPEASPPASRVPKTTEPPGDYRFPYGRTTAAMATPEFEAKMKQGPVGVMSIRPNGEPNMGQLMGKWFVYSLLIAVLAAYITGRTLGPGAPYLDEFRVSGAVTFCWYVVALWHNWIWWGQGTRFTVTNSLDGIIFSLVTGGTFGWLWPS